MNSKPHVRGAVQALLPDRAVRAMSEYFRLEASGGILLIAAALLALICANSPLAETYQIFRGIPVELRIGELEIDKPLLLWINDGLMAIFFLLVAMEIKREALSGQLSSRAQIALPLICAFAGVAVPACIYWAFNSGDAIAMRGWAVPAATDIAFALGVLSLLGSRVPLGMKVLLSTIAVVDDLIAIVIIALFYAGDLSATALVWAGAAIALMVLLNRRGVNALTPYLLLGLVVWFCVLKSGVHATLAGVITGLLIPHVDRLHRAPGQPAADARDGQARDRQAADGRAAEAMAYSPLEYLEHVLHPWVAYAILPLFAFANAGLVLAGLGLDDLTGAVPLGIALGLVLGKPIGIVGAAMIARALGIARYPAGMDTRAMIGLGLLCGIGFTMSLFISGLAFADHDEVFDASVLGVLMASTVAAIIGYVWLRLTLPTRNKTTEY